MSFWMATLSKWTVTLLLVCVAKVITILTTSYQLFNWPFFSGDGITVFDHDKTMQSQIIPYCDAEDCYKTQLEYNRTLSLIELVIDNSQYCEQIFQVILQT